MNFELVEKNAERLEQSLEKEADEKQEKMRSLEAMQAAINRLEGDVELINQVKAAQDRKIEEIVEIDVRLGELTNTLEALEQLNTEDTYRQVSDWQTIEALQSAGENMSEALAIIKQRQTKINENTNRLKEIRRKLEETAKDVR